MGPAEDALHMLSVVFDLPVAEAEGREASCGVRLVADVIPSLGDRGSVIFEAVGLDDESEVGPEEIDLESIDMGFGLRLRQAGPCRDRTEENL